MGSSDLSYPLWPPLTSGCPRTSTESTTADGSVSGIAYPLEVGYDYGSVPASLFQQPAAHGLERWAPLLPPLHGPGLREGNTPLVRLGEGVWVKDESRNPTWSHKDRLNRVTVSAARHSGAAGVVVSSSGNHGASAAAYAARAGLPCVVFASPYAPPTVTDFLRAYGALVLTPPREIARAQMRRVVEEFGYHPVSSLTDSAHTGHPFGAEGYKTIAYEIFLELGEVPSAVYVPTGYGEVLYGVWKGFHELTLLGLASHTPVLYACEPAASGPLSAAIRTGQPAVRVEPGPTEAYSIACPFASYRAVVAVRESGGEALALTDSELADAQAQLAAEGMWFELSSAASLAGLRSRQRRGEKSGDGPVVCVATSSGFKDSKTATGVYEPTDPDWNATRDLIVSHGKL